MSLRLLLALCVMTGASMGEVVVVEERNSAAIQAAIDAAAAGDTVQLGDGSYRMDGAVVLKSGVRLLGRGPEATVLDGAESAGDRFLLIAGCEDVEVGGMALEGGGNAALLQGIHATDSRRLNLHDMALRNIPNSDRFGPHGIHFNGRNPTREGGVTDSRISDCVIESIGIGASFGCGIRMSWGSSRNIVESCTIRGTGRGGIFGDNGSTDLVIRGNTVEGSGGEGLGIEVWGGCDRSVIEDNAIDHWLSVGGCDYCAVRRNVISDEGGTTKPYGLEIIGSFCVVTGNLVDHGQGIGISVSNVDPKNYHYYADNTIRRCYHWGAQLQGEEGGIAYHYFYRCKFLDTLVGHESVVYKGDEGNGFRTNGYVKHLVMEACEVSGNGRHGLQLGGPGVDALELIDCEVRGNQGRAVTGPGEYAALAFRNCTVEENGDDALPEEKPLPGDPPEAELELPAEAVTGETVTLACRAPGAEMVLWDLGAGPVVTGERVEAAYERPGTYRVTAIVWNDAGRGRRVEGRMVVGGGSPE